MQRLYKITNKLNTFLHFITDVSRASFQRLHLALHKMMELVVQHDFDSIQQIREECFEGYVKRYEKVVSGTQRTMGEIMVTLSPTVNESDPRKLYIMKPLVKGTAFFLVASFETLSYLHSHVTNRVTESMPRRLVSDQLSLGKCQLFQTNITRILLSSVLVKVPVGHFDGFNRIALSASDMTELYTLFKMYTSNMCVSELHSDLDFLDNTINEINLEMLQVIGVELGFDNARYLKTETRDLQNIQDTATALSKQLSAYAQNRTTLIQLSTELTQSMLSNMQHNLDRIVYAVERDNIRPLISHSNSMLHNLKQWYRRSMSILPTLVPIYDNINIEDRLRALKIWRRPVARLGTTDILQFQYPATESWRSWELSTNLGDFVRSGTASTRISSTVEEYIGILQSELTKMRLKCKLAREDVIVAINDVMESFTDVRIESSMGRDFVL